MAIVSGLGSAADAPTGEQVYQQRCASCHGGKGEGTIESYPHPLVGERSVGELVEYISKSMPEDKPGTCVGEESRKVAQFIHDTFYSPTSARVPLKPDPPPPKKC